MARIAKIPFGVTKIICYLICQVDWENPVGAMASVSITGAFRFLDEGRFLTPNHDSYALLYLSRLGRKT